MYLGNDYDIDKSYIFFTGYIASLNDNNVEAFSKIENQYINEFDSWLRDKIEIDARGMNWCSMIKFMTPEDENSLHYLLKMKTLFDIEYEKK